MANVFKNELRNNIINGAVEVYSVPTEQKSIIIELDIANVSSGSTTVSAHITSGGSNYYIIKNAPVPVGGSLQVISGQKVVLEAGDALYVDAEGGQVDAICSILEDV